MLRLKKIHGGKKLNVAFMRSLVKFYLVERW